LFASATAVDAPLVGRKDKATKGIWFLPIYTRTNANDLGFDADTYGFALGFGGKLTDNLNGGLFAGYLRNNLDFKVRQAKDEDQNIFLGGLSFMYAPKPWYAKLITYGYYGDHNYTGWTGANYDLIEKADYKSRGFYTEVVGGYIFGDKIAFAPEIGLSYGYHKTKHFTTNVPDNPALNKTYEPDTLDVFKAIAGLNLRVELDKIHLLGGVRLEQALGDNDISTFTHVAGLPKFKLEKNIADTNVVFQAGFNYNLSKQVSFEVGGRVDLNSDYKAYTGRGTLRVAF
jgi:uncharacterized protein with beta-barrel porin domain